MNRIVKSIDFRNKDSGIERPFGSTNRVYYRPGGQNHHTIKSPLRRIDNVGATTEPFSTAENTNRTKRLKVSSLNTFDNTMASEIVSANNSVLSSPTMSLSNMPTAPIQNALSKGIHMKFEEMMKMKPS